MNEIACLIVGFCCGVVGYATVGFMSKLFGNRTTVAGVGECLEESTKRTDNITETIDCSKTGIGNAQAGIDEAIGILEAIRKQKQN